MPPGGVFAWSLEATAAAAAAAQLELMAPEMPELVAFDAALHQQPHQDNVQGDHDQYLNHQNQYQQHQHQPGHVQHQLRYHHHQPALHPPRHERRLDQRKAALDMRLHHAAAQGQAAQVLSLLARGAGLESHWGQDGIRPLASACAAYRAVTTAALLAAGADVNGSDFWGRTPLMLLANRRYGGHPAAAERLCLARWLLKCGARVDAADRGGMTALHMAAWSGEPAMVCCLLEAGACTDARTHSLPVNQVACGAMATCHGMDPTPAPLSTPLHLARDPESIKVLLAHGADPHATDAQGRTPLHLLLCDGGGVFDPRAAAALIQPRTQASLVPTQLAMEDCLPLVAAWRPSREVHTELQGQQTKCAYSRTAPFCTLAPFAITSSMQLLQELRTSR